MNFRTEIDIPTKPLLDISHDSGIVMLGSCFTDNIGELLEHDGFDVVHNPMGPLYNPASILNALSLALIPESRYRMIFKADDAGAVHCLDFASRYVDASEAALRDRLHSELDSLSERLQRAQTVILTLGTAFVYQIEGQVVGNCHKFPADTFRRQRMDLNAVTSTLHSIISLLPVDTNILFTISPIRHTADGLHGNELSKATLQLAVDSLAAEANVHYFPAYEIMLDDLRDYRFYAADMKHPSTVAVDYIYEVFSKYYFTQSTIERAKACRKQYLRQAHRPIL